MAGQGQGYYENLTIADNGNKQYWETMRRLPSNRGIAGFIPRRALDKPPFSELLPDLHREAYGVDFKTNSLGMRDQTYEVEKPKNTLRIALLGSSHVMGYGLAEDAMFERAIEQRLNTEYGTDVRFEMLNFAVPELSPVGQSWMVVHRAAKFDPDIVLYVAHLVDFEWTGRDVARYIKFHLPFPPGMPVDGVSRARVMAATDLAVATFRLEPYAPELTAFFYEKIVQQCRLMGALPVCVYLPIPEELSDPLKVVRIKNVAENAGFIFIDLSGIYQGLPSKELILSDRVHSNAKANALIAAQLYDRLTTDPRIELLARAHRAKNVTAANSPASPPAPAFTRN